MNLIYKNHPQFEAGSDRLKEKFIYTPELDESALICFLPATCQHLPILNQHSNFTRRLFYFVSILYWIVSLEGNRGWTINANRREHLLFGEVFLVDQLFSSGGIMVPLYSCYTLGYTLLVYLRIKPNICRPLHISYNLFLSTYITSYIKKTKRQLR